MKILLSAYSCGPDRGSEPGLGWHWAVETAAAGHETWVVTSTNLQSSIDAAVARMPARHNLHFVYHRIPNLLLAANRWLPLGHIMYRYWQVSASGLVKRLHAEQGFDRLQHVTFVTIRHPSPLAGLGAPFIFGPVSGGERVPWRLRKGFGFRGWATELTRDLFDILVRIDPSVRRTLRLADRIYVTSSQTIRIVPAAMRDKVRVMLAIGADKPPPAGEERLPSRLTAPAGAVRFLFIARLLHWKGMHLGLPAFAAFLAQGGTARLTIVGAGPAERRWRRLADRLDVADRVDWIPWQPRERIFDIISEHDAFLFPSMRDSGGMVVLEALSFGLPVICLDLGGPGTVVDESCGRVIGVAGRGRAQIVRALTGAIAEIAADPDLRALLSQGARKKAAEFEWSAVVRKFLSANPAGADRPVP